MAEKTFYKIQNPFRIKTLSKVGIKETCPNKIKALYNKRTGNIILTGEKLKTFTLTSGTKQRCPFSLLSFNIVLEVLGTGIKKENEPWPGGLVGWSIIHPPKGYGFNSQSGHIPRLQVQSLIGEYTGGNKLMFLSHINVSLSCSFPLPLFLKKQNQ